MRLIVAILMLISLSLVVFLIRRRWSDGADRYLDLGELLSSQDRHAEAEAAFRTALEIQERRFGPDHPRLVAALNALALTCHERGALEDAEAIFLQCAALTAKDPGED